MSSIFQLTVTTNSSAATVANGLAPTVAVNGSDPVAINRDWGSYFHSTAVGSHNTSTVYADTMVNATATLTSTGTASNNETASIANQTITAKTSGAVPANGEFNISGTVATQAANIANAINSLPALAGIVTATSALGVTTITSVVPGIVGNALQASEALTNVALAAFSGGSQAHLATVHAGL